MKKEELKDLRPGNLVIVNTWRTTSLAKIELLREDLVAVTIPNSDYPDEVLDVDLKEIFLIPLDKVSIGEKQTEKLKTFVRENFKTVDVPDKTIKYVHELQNWYYWNSGKQELEIELTHK